MRPGNAGLMGKEVRILFEIQRRCPAGANPAWPKLSPAGREPDLLDRWLRRALTISRVDELFD